MLLISNSRRERVKHYSNLGLILPQLKTQYVSGEVKQVKDVLNISARTYLGLVESSSPVPCGDRLGLLCARDDRAQVRENLKNMV